MGRDGLPADAGAVGPFLGGWLISAVSWRAVFFINVPLCVVAMVFAWRHVPETRDAHASPRMDIAGGVLLAAAFGGIVYALIEGPLGWTPAVVVGAVGGALAVVAFVIVERRSAHPMVPLTLFRSRQFSGANATTLFVYAALGATMFFVVLHLQTDLGYSPTAAGASFLPVTLLMLLFSARSGALAQRIGPRIPMTVGPFVIAVGITLFVRVEPGATFVAAVLPAMVVMGIGLVLTVAPLTAAVLAAVDDQRAGVGSAINNAVARLGSLLAVAVLPGLVGLATVEGAVVLGPAFRQAMLVSAAIAAAGGVVSFLTVRSNVAVRAVRRGNLTTEPCLPGCIEGPEAPPARPAA